MPGPRVSAIVVNHRRPEMTGRCLAALGAALRRAGEPFEVIVVDNGSGDGSADRIRTAMPEAAVYELPANLGFPSAAAHGIRQSSGEWIMLVNNDVIAEPDAVRELLEAATSTGDVGSVAAQMRFADAPDVINSAGIGVDRLGIGFDRLLGQPLSASEDRPVEVFGASGGAALHRRTMLDEVGGMDESYFFALDDADLAWRARMRGWRALYAPAAVVYHEHGATTKHGSATKYFHVGLNRVRTLAKNADRRLLARYGAAMIAYDLAYVAFAVAKDRTLAPARGRLRGLREWPAYRRAGADRLPVELTPVRGLRAALARRRVWLRHSAAANAPEDDGGPGTVRSLAVFHLAGIGGPQRSLTQAMTWLAERGPVDVMLPADGPAARDYARIGTVTVADYSALTYARDVRGLIGVVRRFVRDVRLFRRELRRRRPDVVVVVTTVLPALLVAARLERVPTVVYAAEVYRQEWKASPLLRLWGEMLARGTEALSSGLVSCSATVAEQFRGTAGRPAAVAYPPVGLEYANGDRDGARARLGLRDAEPCLLVVGALSRGRGQDTAIRALARLRRRFPSARLVLVGVAHPRPVDIAYADELRELGRGLGVGEAVVFAGATDAMADVYAASDIVVNPARFAEPFGRVAPEALIAERPVVATRVGAIPEVIRDGIDGILVPPDDAEALADAVSGLVDDPGRARELVANGRRRSLERFCYEQDLAAWTTVLTAAVPGLSERAATADDSGERLEEDLDVLAK